MTSRPRTPRCRLDRSGVRWLLVVVLWLSLAPRASWAGDAVADDLEACDNIGFQGCCEDDIHQLYCSKGVLRSRTCGSSRPLCGWNSSQSFYTCTGATRSEPTGTYPRLCDDLPPGEPLPFHKGPIKLDVADLDLPESPVKTIPWLPCGDFSSEGCCLDDTHVAYCADTKLRSRQCEDGQTCGWNGKGYFCGDDLPYSDPSDAHRRECSDVADGVDTEVIAAIHPQVAAPANRQVAATAAHRDDRWTAFLDRLPGLFWLIAILLTLGLFLVGRLRQ